MSIYFLLFEGLMYSLLAASVLHVYRRRGWAGVWQVLAGVLFGVLLEWATIQQFHAYQYGRFAIMVANEVPLAIGVGWGIIIYATRLFADATTLPRWAKPFLAALVALSIDLAMDVVAIRLGMWDWGQGLGFQYFGVPWPNFWAWFWVVWFFSAGLWWLADGERAWQRWLGPLGAVVLGVAGVLLTNAIIVFLIPWSWTLAAVIAVILGAAMLVLRLHPHLQNELPLLARLTPAAFHAYFLLAGLVSGALLQPPALLGLSLLWAGVWWWGEHHLSRTLSG